eukprot:g9385.t1
MAFVLPKQLKKQDEDFQSVPSLTKLCTVRFANLIGNNHLAISKVFSNLPYPILKLILEELPSDALFFYFVTCSKSHFDIFSWKKLFKLKYVASMIKITQHNDAAIDQEGSWENKHSVPLLPPSLDGFYKDMENSCSTDNFKCLYLELKKMVTLMRSTRKQNISGHSSSTNLEKRKEIFDLRDGDVESQDVHADHSTFSQSSRGLVEGPKHGRKKKKSSRRLCKTKNNGRTRTKGNKRAPEKTTTIKKKTSASAKTSTECKHFDPNYLLVPSIFGCDSTSVSLDFFFPNPTILQNISGWNSLERPPYLPSLRNLSLRGTRLNDALIKKICAQHPLLESLDLMSSMTEGVTPLSLGYLASLAQLKKLNLGMWKEEILGLENLRRFIGMMSEESKRALSPRETRAAKSTMRTLRKNVVVYAPPLLCLSLEETLIKDEALNFLMRECPRLVDINLAGCMLLTNKCLFGLSNPDLRIERLNHAGCYKLTYDGFNRPLLSVHPDVIFYVDTKLFGTTVQVLDA